MASVGHYGDKNRTGLSISGSELPQVLQGDYRGATQLGSTLCFSHQKEKCLKSGGNNPEVLDDAD